MTGRARSAHTARVGDDEPDRPRYWFEAKRYGWGWDWPLTWQGWLAYAVYVGVLLVPTFRSHGDIAVIIVVTAVATPVLFAVCLWKGEPPSWRWGDGTSSEGTGSGRDLPDRW